MSQGRRTFLRPLYEELAGTDWGRALAMRIYRQARPTYHSVSVGTIDGILKWQESVPWSAAIRSAPLRFPSRATCERSRWPQFRGPDGTGVVATAKLP
jgi:hypothetical protein